MYVTIRWCEPFVNDLFDDLQDGLVLLFALDKIHPGSVDWKKVNKPAPIASKFKKVENCNYVVVLGKSLKFSLVGIQGSDLVDGIKKLTLGLVWQLMRENIITILKKLSANGKEITDANMITWANEAVSGSGKKSHMTSCKDSTLVTSHFFLDLLGAIKPGIVNYDLVNAGTEEGGQKMNAKYAISIARKLGATIFLLPEDIMEVKPKMVRCNEILFANLLLQILTFVGALMALAKSL